MTSAPFPPEDLTCLVTIEDWQADMEVFYETRIEEIATLIEHASDVAQLAADCDELFARYVRDDDTPRLEASVNERGDMEIEQAESGQRIVVTRATSGWRQQADDASAGPARADPEDPTTLAAKIIGAIWWGNRAQTDEMATEMEEALIG